MPQPYFEMEESWSVTPWVGLAGSLPRLSFGVICLEMLQSKHRRGSLAVVSHHHTWLVGWLVIEVEYLYSAYSKV